MTRLRNENAILCCSYAEHLRERDMADVTQESGPVLRVRRRTQGHV